MRLRLDPAPRVRRPGARAALAFLGLCLASTAAFAAVEVGPAPSVSSSAPGSAPMSVPISPPTSPPTSPPIPEADLRSRFEQHPWAYGEYRLSHIFIGERAVDPKTGREIRRTQAQALARAKDLRGRLDRGADFARLAREASDDASSAASGGELSSTFGLYLADEFVEAVRALGQGQVSPPVRGASGYHLIRLDAYTPADFALARDMVAVELQEERQTQAAAERLHRTGERRP